MIINFERFHLYILSVFTDHILIVCYRLTARKRRKCTSFEGVNNRWGMRYVCENKVVYKLSARPTMMGGAPAFGVRISKKMWSRPKWKNI